MSRAVGAALAALSFGCGNLTTTSDGVAFLQVELPVNRTIEVGGTLQFRATALDKDGNPLAIPIVWRTPDTTITVDAAGLVTGVAPDSGRVQALVGGQDSNTKTPLISDFITVFVLEPQPPPAHRRP